MVRLRMAPSPTGLLHIGLARTFLFNWLYARQQGGECRLRIENTDTSREVAEATEQIQRSLRWLGIEWDGDVTFQLDRLERCKAEAYRLVDDNLAYEDEGAIRFRMPEEGVTAWDDLVLGPLEFRNEELDDLVILRSDGRPLYNFASPVEDWLDGITHVVRGMDHVSNTPRQINILRALGSEIPRYGHVPMINGADGKKLSKRHGALSLEEFKKAGYLREALMNFLALLGWSYDDHTTIMSEQELIERFSFDRVQASPAVFDYQKLDWMNGVYIRELPVSELADRLVEWLREQGYGWDAELVRATAPLVQEKISTFGAYPDFVRFFFEDVQPDTDLLDPHLLQEAEKTLAQVEPFDAEHIEQALRGLTERLERSPRKAFQPIRVAVTGSRVSPGLFESLELLGKEKSLARLRAAASELA